MNIDEVIKHEIEKMARQLKEGGEQTDDNWRKESIYVPKGSSEKEKNR